MSVTGWLFRLARLSADLRAARRTIETGSPEPVVRRLVNKVIGRGLVSKLFWRGKW